MLVYQHRSSKNLGLAFIVWFSLFQLSSGPISAYERVQINFLVKRIPEYHIFDSIAKDVWIPVLWYEESFSIPFLDLGLIIGSIV